MAAVTPSSDLYLLQCPIEIDNRNQIDFTNATSQYNYFFGLNKIGETNFSYQRKDSTIRYPAHIDTIREFNYCMYRNDNYSNKWFYAFIESMEYLNDSTTLIKIKTDVYQTWQFDLTFKNSFVVREHVNDDTVGAHTIPEGLETGEYVCSKYQSWRYHDNTYMICMQVTNTPNNFDPSDVTQKYYNRVIQGCWILGFAYTQGGVDSMNKVLKWYDSNNKGNAVVSLFVVPKAVITWRNRSVPLGNIGTVTVYFPEDSNQSTTFGSNTFAYDTSLNGYIPKNNKLYTAPYNYFTLSNCCGDVYNYKFEDFTSSPQFLCVGCLTQNAQIRAYPNNYKKSDINPVSAWDFGVNAGKYPILSWLSDYYLNWQAQNSKYITQKQVMNGFQLGGGIMQSIGRGIKGDIIGSITGGYDSALSFADNMLEYAHQTEVAEMLPDTAKGNTNSGDLNFAFAADRFMFRQMSVRYEYAKIIDDYFSAVGYKVNSFKMPNLRGRSNWNYVQTKGCNIIANIPQEDLDEIKLMFDSGITIWHKTAYFLDYSQNNPIVS